MLEGMLQKDKDEFTRICNRLLSQCFLCKKNEATRADFYFIMKYKEKFTQYLSVLGYRLEINEEYGVVQLVNMQNYAFLPNIFLFYHIFHSLSLKGF